MASLNLFLQPKNLFIHKEDWQLPDWGFAVRPVAPDPAVFPLSSTNVIFTKEWQFYLVAINYAMELRYVAGILEYHRAFANGTGFDNPDEPRSNYILRTNLDAPYPALDKVRTCARSMLSGKVILDNNYVELVTMDGRYPPPLKPGHSQPTRVEDVNPDAYVYMPKTHPWLFLVANIVRSDGSLFQFPNGAIYDWTGDNVPRTFLPHVSRTSIVYPRSRLSPIQSRLPWPSPYKN